MTHNQRCRMRNNHLPVSGNILVMELFLAGFSVVTYELISYMSVYGVCLVIYDWFSAIHMNRRWWNDYVGWIGDAACGVAADAARVYSVCRKDVSAWHARGCAARWGNGVWLLPARTCPERFCRIMGKREMSGVLWVMAGCGGVMRRVFMGKERLQRIRDSAWLDISGGV